MVGLRFAAGLAALALAAAPAVASGPGSVSPWYVDQFGGERADLLARYDGRLGIVMARSPEPHLFMAWRLLHGLKVGRAAGEALAVPCCDAPVDYSPDTPPTGVFAWLEARKLVAGAPEVDYVPTEREGPDYTSIPNCFPDAFDVAAATLKARAATHGAGSAQVRAWLDTQDAVFKACHDTGVVLPAAIAPAPAWLAADRAYQEAAFALYDGRNGEAAARFSAIAEDRGSPWAASAPYLVVRAKVREALKTRTPAAFAEARKSARALAAMPGAYGRTDAVGMDRVLDYRERPAELLARLDGELARAEPPADVAVGFRDYANLGRKTPRPPEAMDWINTIAARVDDAAVAKAQGEGEDYEAALKRVEAATLAAARARAEARWTASRDPAWLIAAMSLADPGAPTNEALIKAGEAVRPGHPAWLTVQHHLVRLKLPNGDAAALRTQLDAILARRDLSVSDRNVFTAQRLQVAADAREFARLSLRQRLCGSTDEDSGCVREAWLSDSVQPGGVYDGEGFTGTMGLGEDARAVIDRMALADRIALSRDASLAAPFRLDIALTSFARAVQLQDDAQIDGLSRDLAVLLPQMAADFRAIVAAAPGADKRFAEFFVLAKIPGVRTDLVDYTRPEGTVAQFQQYWTNWFVPAKGRPPGASAPKLAAYQQGGYGVARDAADHETDLACLGECGRGTSPLRLPAFVEAGEGRARAERAYFHQASSGYDETPAPPPTGATAAWDEMLAYADAHPNDPRVPEALYWLVRVGRFGGSHNHSGRRAFKVLHARYPKSPWTAKSPYFYD